MYACGCGRERAKSPAAPCMMAARPVSSSSFPWSYIRLGLVFIWLIAIPINASNWAQTTGYPKQNNIIPRIPNSNIVAVQRGPVWGKNDHWSQRQGMAVVTVPANNSHAHSIADSIFVIGGDSYLRHSTYMEHGGQYKNDVWYTQGVTWNTIPDREARVSCNRGRCLCDIYM